LFGPSALAVDASGNLYIADRYNYRIRMVSLDGTINTVAGSGSCCYNGDGIEATKATLCEPSGLALDGSGALYIADYCNNRVRRVDADGTIASIAGNGTSGYAGDGGVATAANLQDPYGIFVDAAGNIVFTDQNNNAVRLLTPIYGLPVLTIQSTHAGPFTPGQNGAIYVLTVSNAAVAGPAGGTVTVAELLPSALSLVSMTGNGWTCAGAVCTRSDTLSGGASYPPITVTVNVAANAPGQLMAAATVSGGGAASTAAAQDFTIVQR
jgi:hypothetical protein